MIQLYHLIHDKDAESAWSKKWMKQRLLGVAQECADIILRAPPLYLGSPSGVAYQKVIHQSDASDKHLAVIVIFGEDKFLMHCPVEELQLPDALQRLQIRGIETAALLAGFIIFMEHLHAKAGVSPHLLFSCDNSCAFWGMNKCLHRSWFISNASQFLAAAALQFQFSYGVHYVNTELNYSDGFTRASLLQYYDIPGVTRVPVPVKFLRLLQLLDQGEHVRPEAILRVL
jgi:hypothetical protein